MMKILFIVDKFSKLSSESFTINHITALLDAGHEVKIIARKEPEEKKDPPGAKEYGLLEKTCYFDLPQSFLARLLAAPGKIIKSQNSIDMIKDLNPLRYGLGTLSLQSLFRCNHLPKQRFDIIHCNFGTIAWNCLGLKSMYNAPMVTSIHGATIKRYGKLGGIIFWHLFRYCDGFIANSGYTKKRLEAMGCPSEKIEKIPVIAIEKGVRRRLQILDSSIVTILSVSRLVEAKGIQFCLHAVKNLTTHGYNLRYIVVGDGLYKESLEKLMARLELNDIVYFTGSLDQNEVYKFYEMADIFVLPSVKTRDGWVETQGLVIQEAQQQGLAVIGSNIGGIPEGLNWGKAGLLFEPGNVIDLTNKIKRLLDNPDIARDVAQAGRKYFLEYYSKDVIINKLNVFYKRCISEFMTTIHLNEAATE